MNRTCPGCEKVFEARNERHRFCSRECRTKRGGPPCYVCGLPLSGSSGKGSNGRRSAGKHKSCFEHGFAYAYDKHGCRCDLCREAKNEVLRGQYARASASGRRKNRTLYRDVCAQCGADFESRRKEARFCSPECVGESQLKAGSKRFRRRERERSRHRLAGLKRLEVAARGFSTNRVWVQGNCLICGCAFAPSPGVDSRYCSVECRELSRRLRNWISYPERLAIYERDGWVCYLCGEPVDRGLPSNDQMGASLDHVVPRVDGGADDAVNLRLAHRLCNSVKRDLTVGEARAELRSLGVCA